MERYIWKSGVSRNHCPQWICPECEVGRAKLIKDSFASHETQRSKNEVDDNYFHPENRVYGFSTWAVCDNEKCQQKFCISGIGGNEPDVDADGEQCWIEYFLPKYCFPMPKIIRIPKATPWAITAELTATFPLFWLNREACAGRIRVSIERLLDDLGVDKEGTAKNGNRFDLKLHDRIKLFEEINKNVGQILMALKSLGNSGSHSGSLWGSGVTQDDLLDAFDIIEHALMELFENRSAEVAAISAKMQAKHKK